MRMFRNQWATLLTRSAAVGAAMLLSAGNARAATATITRSADVHASVSQVWSLIGPFCAIKEWLPPVGQCIEDGKTPSTRILVTKDGKAAFVERQTARSEAEHSYSYTFLSSPLPVSKYTSTIKVVPKGNRSSTIIWTGSFIAERGKEEAARKALNGVYEAGLSEITQRLAK